MVQTGKFDFKDYKDLDAAELTARVQKIRDAMGPELLILGHHYQQDDVIALSDLRGDSLQLASLAAQSDACKAIAFCGVHFMAETADILANRPEKLAARGGERVTVVLPDMTAGCSLADMAAIDQVEECWRQLGEVIDVGEIMPITYVNSAASLKAFCGRHGGVVCTSSNAKAVLTWAFSQRRRALFFPDQHLGRNTAKRMGVPSEQMPLWNPRKPELGGNSREAIQNSRVLLWQGHCSVHQVFLPEHIDQFRAKYPGIQIIVHPECRESVADKADVLGSTGKIIETIEKAPAGSRWAIATELNLVNRLKNEHPEQEIFFLAPMVCICSTMYRIDLPHLCWALENLKAGEPVNVIQVDPDTARDALLALQRMLEIK